MSNKTLKFMPFLATLILNGSKTCTWRLFDDKDLKEGDLVDFVNKETLVQFAQAKLIKVYEKSLGELSLEDELGHEPIGNKENMYKTYGKYYGREVKPETKVKIIRFELVS